MYALCIFSVSVSVWLSVSILFCILWIIREPMRSFIRIYYVILYAKSVCILLSLKTPLTHYNIYVHIIQCVVKIATNYILWKHILGRNVLFPISNKIFINLKSSHIVSEHWNFVVKLIVRVCFKVSTTTDTGLCY